MSAILLPDPRRRDHLAQDPGDDHGHQHVRADAQEAERRQIEVGDPQDQEVDRPDVGADEGGAEHERAAGGEADRRAVLLGEPAQQMRGCLQPLAAEPDHEREAAGAEQHEDRGRQQIGADLEQPGAHPAAGAVVAPEVARAHQLERRRDEAAAARRQMGEHAREIVDQLQPADAHVAAADEDRERHQQAEQHHEDDLRLGQVEQLAHDVHRPASGGVPL